MHWHASCAARQSQPGGDALLLLGPSGSGKSDLLLRLIEAGFTLVADDQVWVEAGMASPPAALAGLLEVRGVGLFQMPYTAPARVRLVIRLGEGVDERLPSPRLHDSLGVPELKLDASQPSAVARASLALEAACGRLVSSVGAFGA